MNIADYYKDRKWNQGDIIDDDSAIKALLKCSCDFILPCLQDSYFLVIISQDCDILHSPEGEPYIDFLLGRFLSEKNGNLWNGKNPRRLQVSFNGENGRIFEFSIHDKFRVNKADFVKINPKKSQITLVTNDLKIIILWVSKRYTRAAFPDEFNLRLKKADKQLTALSKDPLMEFVSLIFVNTSETELPPNKKYMVKLVIGINHSTDQETRSQIEDLFQDSFDIPGIMADAQALDEYDITYEIIKTYKRFDWDYRSLPENSNTATPASGIDSI